jgi:hypothetical protein
MSILKNILVCIGCGLLLMPFAAKAGPLMIAEVDMGTLDCLFFPGCNAGPATTGSAGTFIPPGDVGTGLLTSRTFPAANGAPQAGSTAYVYRVNMEPVAWGNLDNCVAKLMLDIGPIAELRYHPNDLYPADVFVVTKGAAPNGLGTVGLSSAVQTGSVITFTFSQPICPNGSVTNKIPGQMSFFFGVVSRMPSKPSTARVVYTLGGGAFTAARVPTH